MAMAIFPVVKPLREGRVSIRDQAATRGVAVPVDKSVKTIRELGFDVDAEWEDDWILREDQSSPTGYSLKRAFSEGTAMWALAT